MPLYLIVLATQPVPLDGAGLVPPPTLIFWAKMHAPPESTASLELVELTSMSQLVRVRVPDPETVTAPEAVPLSERTHGPLLAVAASAVAATVGAETNRLLKYCGCSWLIVTV